MASSIPMCFSPNALARSNTHNPRRPTRPTRPNRTTTNKPRPNPKFNKQIATYASPPEPVVLSGGEATTYTRLPPKDDYSAPTSSSSSSELKLSDSTPPTFNHPEQLEIEELEGEEIEELEDDDDDDDDDDEAFDGNFRGDYQTLEIFEGNGGAELDSEDEEEEEEEEDGIFDDSDEFLSFENGEEEPVKEKGVPAVMRCFDRAKIYVKAGDGGNGVVAFRREKYVPLGGPSGGDGGKGGNVYVEVDRSVNSLLPFRKSVHFRAGRGGHGQGRMMSGAKGEDLVVKVAPGTVVREAGKDEVLLEMVRPGQRALVLPGGRGGRGNASFKSGTNKVPKIAENGEQGPDM